MRLGITYAVPSPVESFGLHCRWCPVRSPDPYKIFRYVGELAIRWNDLELALKRLASRLRDDDLVVTIFLADMQASSLIQAVRSLAAEHDIEAKKLNDILDAVRQKRQHGVVARSMIMDHVECVLTCSERLRLYRNLFIHGINWPTDEVPYFSLGGMTVRGKNRRLAFYEFPIKIKEIQRVASAVRRLVEYTHRIEYCIHLNQKVDRKSTVKWPKKLTPYPELKKPYVYFTDDTPLF